jgi:hypothetical protein
VYGWTHHQATASRFVFRYALCQEQLTAGQVFVFVCIDRYLERQVAIKVMKHASDITLLNRRSGPWPKYDRHHVAELYDFFTDKRSGMCALIEEFVRAQAWTNM